MADLVILAIPIALALALVALLFRSHDVARLAGLTALGA
jgi:hypothetical protein